MLYERQEGALQDSQSVAQKVSDVVLTFDSIIKINSKHEFRLEVPNRLGFVKEPKLWFNRHGEVPGSFGSCELSYSKKDSNDGVSVFKGYKKFDTTGYVSFYCSLTINDHPLYVLYDFDDERTVLATGFHYGYFECNVYSPTFRILKQAQGGIGYEIFIDTFRVGNPTAKIKEKCVNWNAPVKWRPDADGEYRNDQFYGGDLRGIIEMIPYIISLHVTVVYITCIYKSPSQNRYDSINYEDIDEMIGTYEDLDELHAKLNEAGIALCVDVAYNHSSIESPMLKEHRDMYQWHNGETVGWFGFKPLSQYDQTSSIYKKNLKTWVKNLEPHIDMFRIDLGDALLSSTMDLLNKYSSKPLMAEFWKHPVTGEYRDALNGHRYDCFMNYLMANAIYRYIIWGDPDDYKMSMSAVYRLIPHEALNQSGIFLTSHDIPRIQNILRGVYMQKSTTFENVWDMERFSDWLEETEKIENGVKVKVKEFSTLKFREWEAANDDIPENEKENVFRMEMLARVMQYTHVGIPYLFAGDELGVTGYKDPNNRKTMPWERAQNPDKRLKFYQDLGAFRSEYREVFEDPNNYRPIYTDEYINVYRRGPLGILINRSRKNFELSYIIEGKEILFSAGEELTFIKHSIVPERTAIIYKY